MSAQLVEILFLGGVAFFIISKFISMLGTTDDEDPARNLGSNFGEPTGLKNVTGTAPEADERVVKILRLGKKIKQLDAEGNEPLLAVLDKFPNFDPEKFLSSAKSAFNMIITALHEKDSDTLEELVDKRFVSQIRNMTAQYGAIARLDQIKASCIDSYNFGNSVYVRVLFEGSNVTDKMKSLKEEWVFTKNITQRGPDWYLSNIDRPK